MSARKRVTIIVPCFDRPDDLALLMADLARLDTTGLEVDVIIVDNGSREPILVPQEHPLRAHVLRLSINTGGSGGYNAGMAHALAHHRPDLLWLVDSDARVEADTLTKLASTLDSHDDLFAVGPILKDPSTDEVHEVGGVVNRSNGVMGPATTDTPGALIRCDYAAACCLLVRADVVRTRGVFPPIFLNGDDSAWCIRLANATGQRVGIEPTASAAHPRFDGFPTFARYYSARNAFEPMAALGLGPWARFRRGAIETMRAVNLAMTGLDDLARLHLAGLNDASRGRTTGKGVPPSFEPFEGPPPEGTERVEPAGSAAAAIPGLLKRLVFGPPLAEAVAPAKGHPSTWLCARTVYLHHAGRAIRRDTRRWAFVASAFGVLVRGLWLSARTALRSNRPAELPPVDVALACAPIERPCTPSLSVIVLSYNRKAALLDTLERLTSGSSTANAEIIVVDNASTDGSVDAVRERFASVRTVANERNELIEGFNIGVRAATGDLVLILDDDARPDQEHLAEAISTLGARAELGGATLHPVHPATGVGEWPFVRTLRAPTDDWPVMGCCNLVRRDLWLAIGGYDARFGLYRNDVDLAMRILSVGMGVRFDPRWTCEHDSPAAARKSVRWCEQATRNWVWLCKRHGRLASASLAIALGWMAAHRHAGPRLRAQMGVLRGVLVGLGQQPVMPGWWRRDDRPLRRLLSLRMGKHHQQ